MIKFQCKLIPWGSVFLDDLHKEKDLPLLWEIHEYHTGLLMAGFADHPYPQLQFWRYPIKGTIKDWYIT